MKVICTPNTQRLPHWEAFFFYTTRRKPLEVKINKEIQSYSESMFFGLSMRQCGFSLAAMLVAVGLCFLLKPYVGTETVSWMCILGAAPFAAMGFMNYRGMTAEQFAWAWFRSEDVDAARSFFARVEADLSAHFAALGSTCGPTNAMERLQILHRFYRRGEENEFRFSLRDSARKGHSFRDYICPDSMERHSNYLQIGKRYARVLYLKDYASYIP